jgi:hypothetical protein
MATEQCSAGLECLPLEVLGAGSVITPLAIGTCQPSNYAALDGSVSGMTCTGECKSASDCCLLPPNVSVNGTTYHSCLDILTQVIGGSTSICSGLANGDSSPVGIGCFYYQAYCNGCGTNGSNWQCTNSKCVYAASCQSSDVVVGGCAPLTRTGRTLPTTCSSNNKCTDAVAPACAQNSDCAGQSYIPYTTNTPFSDNTICTADAGTATDCVCHSGSCYLACNQDLDCANGYSCDTSTHLCKSLGRCTTDAQCVQIDYNPLAKCVSNACVVPCSSDQDCNSAGTAGFTGQACVNGTCQTLGCTSDTDCNILGRSDVRMFCVTPAATTVGEVSAITN